MDFWLQHVMCKIRRKNGDPYPPTYSNSFGNSGAFAKLNEIKTDHENKLQSFNLLLEFQKIYREG